MNTPPPPKKKKNGRLQVPRKTAFLRETNKTVIRMHHPHNDIQVANLIGLTNKRNCLKNKYSTESNGQKSTKCQTKRPCAVQINKGKNRTLLKN